MLHRMGGPTFGGAESSPRPLFFLPRPSSVTLAGPSRGGERRVRIGSISPPHSAASPLRPFKTLERSGERNPNPNFAILVVASSSSSSSSSSMSSCGCVVLQEVEREKANSMPRVSYSSSSPADAASSSISSLRLGLRKCPSESIFPIYAMENARPNSMSRAILDSAGDPIWEAVRVEAKSEVAENEPILSSFLYASVLSHDCLERALCFVLANRLQNPTLLATQLMDIFDDVMMSDTNIRRSIRLDAQAFKDRDPACAQYSWALLYLKGYHSLQSYRIAHVLWNRGRKVLALALQSRISEVFAVDIHPAARIGEGILLDHGTGLVIGETAVVGNWGVTLGGTGKEHGDRHPKIGQGALIGAGATILGNIVVGEGAMIAAGSLVLKDVPPHSMAVGNPAKIVGFSEDEDPSFTMKHDARKDYFEHVAACKRTNGCIYNEKK
ncbi:putative serine acetyltransferase 2 [Ananas comosus]|uniref:serine O-acetyltransferase n=1 Tax=Ananas comosus TaxID=4615 RepID=A0A199UL40_ANACO|nr:putative serine acetyltransferase 2 [Ananas comosus]